MTRTTPLPLSTAPHRRLRQGRAVGLSFALAALLGLGVSEALAADEYWRTDGNATGSWTSNFWNLGSANSTGGTGWTSGNNAVFTAGSTLTFATSTVGNVTVSNGSTVNITAGGTLTFNPLVSTFDIGTGSTLTWQSQSVTANSASGITKNGAGILDLGALTFTTNMTGGFTLNNGTVIVSGDKALGNGALALNGGTLQSSGTRTFTTTSITVGGDFALAGTGNANWDAATTIALGAASRTITNSTTSGSRQFRGLISGAAGSGLTFAGAGSAQVYIGNTGNTFTGPVAITGGEVVFNDNGSFGNTSSITLDGGRLTIASMNTGGTTAALTAATIATARNIFVGASAGTSISIQGSTGVTTYNGVIADKTGSTGILVKQGAGKLLLGGASAYSGQTSINNGTVQLTTGSDRLPTGTVVNLGQAASANLGTLDLNGNSQTIAGLTSTAGTNATASTNVVTSAGAATLSINASGSNSYLYSAGTQANSGIISGAISLVKTGSGTQTLGGANSYTGPTAINGGILAVSGSLTGNGAVTLTNANSTLSSGVNTTSAITGSVTANTGTFLTPGGAGTVGTFTLGGLTMNGGSTLNADILGNSNFDKIVTSGVLTLGAGTQTINIAGSGFTAGSFTLVSGYSSLSGGAFTLGSTPGGFNYSLATGATATVLTVSNLGGSGNLTWSLGGLAPTASTDGAGTWVNGGTNFYNTGTSAATTWDNTATNALTIGSGGAGGTITLGGNVRVGGGLTLASASSPYVIGAVAGTNTLTLAAGIAANNAATINAPTVLEASQSWDVSTGTLTANGAVSETGGAKTLTKAGAGTLVLASASNSYSGGTVLGGGILSVGADANLGNTSGGLTFSGGTLQTSAGITSARAITLDSGGGVIDTNGFDSSLSGNIIGAGALTKNGAGALVLSGTNTFGGGTLVNAGALTNNGSYSGATTLAGGTLNNGGSITLSGAAVAVSVTGNNATLTNLGTISQTGTGRAIRDTTGVTGLVITNGSATNSTALLQTANADVIQMSVANASVTLNNYGTMTSLNGSAGGSQAVDFAAIQTGSNIVNNFATGIMQAAEADAVRPGANGAVNNDGLIKSTTTTGSSSDGVDAQTNSGVVIVNAASAGSGTGTGTIEGARHGITGGNVTGSGAYTMSVTNNLGGTIKGNNGSGINIDGINGNEIVTVINHGTITGNGVTGDGDGLDVDGLVNVTNTGLIRSINAFSSAEVANSEGLSVGGGTIINSGTIEGLVASGNTNAVGRGISLLGNDVTTGPLAGSREAIYGNATVTNQAGGLIRGDSDSGILVGGPASGFTVTINNNAGATIRGGGVTNAAVLTGADNDTINNAGTIDGSSSGKAIDLGAGNDSLKITGGAASVLGSVNGGAGTNTLTLDPGTGNSFAYAGAISNFSSVEVKSGTVTLSAISDYTGVTKLSGGQLTLDGANLINSASSLDLSGGNLKIIASGPNGQTFASLTLSDNSTIDLDPTSLTFLDIGSVSLGKTLSILNYDESASPNYAFRFVGDLTSDPDFLALINETTIDGEHPRYFFDGSFTDVEPVPEPSTIGFGLALVGMIGWRQRRQQSNS